MIDIYSKEFVNLEKATRLNLGINKRVLISPEHVIDLIETIKELLADNSRFKSHNVENSDFDKWFSCYDGIRSSIEVDNA